MWRRSHLSSVHVFRWYLLQIESSLAKNFFLISLPLPPELPEPLLFPFFDRGFSLGLWPGEGSSVVVGLPEPAAGTGRVRLWAFCFLLSVAGTEIKSLTLRSSAAKSALPGREFAIKVSWIIRCSVFSMVVHRAALIPEPSSRHKR